MTEDDYAQLPGVKRARVIGGQVLLQGDCLEVMPGLGEVDMVCTSPPYDNLRSYGEGWAGVDLFSAISCIADRLTRGGVCMWNVADATVNGSETGSSFRQALYAIDCGLRLHDTMIYCKGGVTYPDANRYLPCFEYMFVFSNGAPNTFNPIKDRPNKWAGTAVHGTDRNKDGTTKRISGMGRPVPALGLRRNWWEISNAWNGETLGHPAPMPYTMAHDHVVSWSNQNDIVMDPFLGSGTTLVACQKLGRRGIGIELDSEYFDMACKRVEEAARQPDLFVQPAEAPQQEGFDL